MTIIVKWIHSVKEDMDDHLGIIKLTRLKTTLHKFNIFSMYGRYGYGQ